MVSRFAFAVAVLAISAFVLAEGDKEAPKTKQVYGQISAVDGGKVTVTTKGERGVEGTATFTVVEGKTKIQVATGETEEVKGDNGEVKKKPKMADGKLEDLVKGARVRATVQEDGTALTVSVLPANVKKEGGDKPKSPKPEAAH